MEDFISFYKRIYLQPLYFILGAQGSGTNLLCNILRNIFDFSIVRDGSLIFNAAVNIYQNNSPKTAFDQFQKVRSKMFPKSVAKRLQLKHYHHRARYFIGIEEFFNEVQIENEDDFAKFIYGYHAFSEGKNHIAVKSDDIWENISYLDKIFQNYRYIFLTRDCRDNVLSILHKNFGPRSVYFGAQYIKDRVNVYQNEVGKHPDVTLQVKYEELLTNPADFIRKFSKMSGIVPPVDIDNRLENLKIRKTNFQKWKTLMSKEELLTCETILRDELHAMGYGTENQSFQEFSNSKILRERIYDVLFRIPQKMKRLSQSLLGN